jgi:hypothetical protein
MESTYYIDCLKCLSMIATRNSEVAFGKNFRDASELG